MILNLRQERQIVRNFISGKYEAIINGLSLAKKDVLTYYNKIIHKNGLKNYHLGSQKKRKTY